MAKSGGDGDRQGQIVPILEALCKFWCRAVPSLATGKILSMISSKDGIIGMRNNNHTKFGC